MKKFDIIIIGSGFGGLVCGYILSKNGFKVGIFEKHFQIGGCLQAFKRKGITFDTGMHYIGSMEPGQVMHRIFSYLNLLDDVKLQKLDTDGFEHISINGKEYRFAMGFDNFVEELLKDFPNERETLERYVQDIQKHSAFPPNFSTEKFLSNDFSKDEAVNTGIGDYFDSLTSNFELQNVLSATNLLYAGKREITPLYIHSHINNFYIQSAWRIVGGSDTIVESLCRSIKKFGGEIFESSEVKSINCNHQKATSITLSNGEVVECNNIISNTHPELTLQMVQSPLLKRVYRERLASIENTISYFSLFIIFKPNTVPYINYNYYKFNNNDVWDCLNYTSEDWPRNYIFMHQAPHQNNGFAESGTLIAYMNFSEVEKWSNTTIEKRGEEYKKFKESKKEILLQQLEKDFAGIRNNIQDVYASSPLTLRDYTGTKNGSMYGFLKDKNRPEHTIMSHKTKIPNLFFTGQNINSHGLLGVAVSAIMTSSEFVDLKKTLNEIF